MVFMLRIVQMVPARRARPEGGAALVEYAILTSLVLIVSLAAVEAFGQHLAAEFVSISSAI